MDARQVVFPDNTYAGVTGIGAVTAAPLTPGGSPAEVVTCVAANTNYAAAGAVPEGAAYIEVGCDSSCVVALGEATSATVGRYVPAGGASFPVKSADIGKTVNVQSATAGALVRLSYPSAS
jgi:hypothetical protein